jgi:transposase
MATTTRRQFTDAFKFEAVRLTRESGRPVAQVARELGLEIGCATAGGASSNRSNPRAARVRWCESSRTSSHGSGEKMRRCGRNGIF